jgi:ketosteroid isomerase-like protein
MLLNLTLRRVEMKGTHRPIVLSEVTVIIAIAIAVSGWLVSPEVTPSRQPSAAGQIIAVVSEFHAALATSDSATALWLLDPDAIVLESGDVETRDEYRANHLAADIEFARAVPGKRTVLSVTVVGDAGWIASKSDNVGRTGTRSINSVGAELMVLRKRDTGWKIAAIHWSSRTKKPPEPKTGSSPSAPSGKR